MEFTIGDDLKDQYGYGTYDRLRLEAEGNPRWDGNQCRLEIHHDDLTDEHRAFQPMTVSDFSPESEALASHEAVTRNRRFLVTHQT